MDDLEEIKNAQLESLKASYAQQQQLQQQVALLENMIKSRLSKEAYQRYATMKLAHPENAMHALVVVSQMLQENPYVVLDDEQFKRILTKILPKKREMKITRK